MSAFSVFGNPIKHSKSPQIYSIFAKQYGISQIYTRILAFWLNFDYLLKDFFSLGGVGANITMPFKERAFFLCDKVTSRAAIAGSVNTIKKEIGDILLGDNTDGIGLLTDLTKRLGWLKENNDNHLGKIRVLLLGAGGAARGIIPPLLSFGCQVDVMNRSILRAKMIVDHYKHLGDISCINCSTENIVNSDTYFTIKYDIIINATTGLWVNDKKPMLPEYMIGPDVACYDMSYGSEKGELTPFISWCKKNGALKYSDGWGMLVGQAAHAFLFWHGIYPSVDLVLRKIK